MKFTDIIRLSWQSLRRRKSRTILTVLGVLVGCCSIMLMMSLAQGLSQLNEQTLKSLGDLTIIKVSSPNSNAGMSSSSLGSSPRDKNQQKLDDDLVATFKVLDHVAAVTPHMSVNADIAVTTGAGDRYVASFVMIEAIDFSQLETMDFKLSDGAFPTKSGEVLFGKNFVYSFGDKLNNGESRNSGQSFVCDANGQCHPEKEEDPYFDPTSAMINLFVRKMDANQVDYYNDTNVQAVDRLSIVKLTSTGVLEQDGMKLEGASSYGLLMSINDLKANWKKLNVAADGSKNQKIEDPAYDSIIVKVDSIDHVEDVEKQIKQFGYTTYSSTSYREQLQKQNNNIQLIFGGIGAVSLFVAAIGIANTMIMAVTERTREIGIMKALGCYVKDIRRMFLVEAGFIGFIGGLVGCLLSGIISFMINMATISSASAFSETGAPAGFWQTAWKAIVGGDDVVLISQLPWWLFFFAMIFAIGIGVLFGIQPANKAVKIPALDAIKDQQ